MEFDSHKIFFTFTFFTTIYCVNQICNPVQDGLFRGSSQMLGERGESKIQQRYKSRDTPLEFCWHQHFLLEISTLCYIKKYRFRLHFDALFQILLSFFESLKIVLINMVIILMMSAKMAALGKNTFKIKGILN